MYFEVLTSPLEKKVLGTASEPSFYLYITWTTESQCVKDYLKWARAIKRDWSDEIGRPHWQCQGYSMRRASRLRGIQHIAVSLCITHFLGTLKLIFVLKENIMYLGVWPQPWVFAEDQLQILKHNPNSWWFDLTLLPRQKKPPQECFVFSAQSTLPILPT